MKKIKSYLLDFKKDRLTNLIINTISGDSFLTEVSLLIKSDLKPLQENNGWLFNWQQELQLNDREIYKLTIVNNPTIIQGLICFTDKKDHIFMPLIESSKFNKGRQKLYKGVAGNLVAFGFKVSFEKSYDGVVSFIAKSQLIEHYHKTLGVI